MSKAQDVAGTLLPALPAGREWIPVRNGESGDAVYRRSDDAAYAKIAQGRSVRDLEGERHRIAWLAQFDLGTATFLD